MIHHHHHPAIWIGLRGRYLASIEQCPTSTEAQEKAGTDPGSFAWGRFVIYGGPEVLEEIKKKLW
jgi:hypothetical protein